MDNATINLAINLFYYNFTEYGLVLATKNMFSGR